MKTNKDLTQDSPNLLLDSLSKIVILPGESRKELAKIRNNLVNDLNPEGSVEGLLCSKVVTDTWKLRRMYQFERKILLGQQKTLADDYSLYGAGGGGSSKGKRFRSTEKQLNYTVELEKVQKHQARLVAGLLKTIKELRAIQKDRQA